TSLGNAALVFVSNLVGIATATQRAAIMAGAAGSTAIETVTRASIAFATTVSLRNSKRGSLERYPREPEVRAQAHSARAAYARGIHIDFCRREDDIQAGRESERERIRQIPAQARSPMHER